MKRNIFLCLIILCSSFRAIGQTEEVKVERSLLSAYFIPLKLSYEQGLGKSNTIELGGGLTGTSWMDDYDQFQWGIVPFVEGYFKNYYNLEKRSLKGKHTAKNSGNYWGLYSRYRFDPLEGDVDEMRFNSLFLAPVWGFQRNYGSGFSLGMDLGAGAGFNNHGAYFGLVVKLKLGFVLFAYSGKNR